MSGPTDCSEVIAMAAAQAQSKGSLFIIGGGGIWVRAKNCRAEVKNDTLFFFYESIINNAPTGEASPTMMCLEIDKIKYPNYRNLKIKYVHE